MNQAEKTYVSQLIDRFFEGFISNRLRAEEGEHIVEELQDRAQEAVGQLIQHLEKPDPDIRFAALSLLSTLETPRVTKTLRRLLNDPEHSVEEKLFAVRMLDERGISINPETLQRLDAEFEAVEEQYEEELLKHISKPEQMEALLEMISDEPVDAQVDYLRHKIVPLADPRTIHYLTALLHSEEDEIILAAIDAIERIKNPATIPVLEERGQYDPSTVVRHAAKNAALRLRTRVGPPSDIDLPWVEPLSTPTAHCIVSTIDGDGGQVLIATQNDANGGLTMFDVMFNDHQGIKDAFTASVSEQEVEEISDSFGSTEFVDVSLERARATLEWAYQTTLEAHRRLPPAYIVWQGFLLGEDPNPPEVYPLPDLPADEEARDDLLAESDELLTMDEFEYWFFNPDEVEDFVKAYRRLRRDKKARRGEPAFEDLLDRAIEAVVGEEWRRRLVNRLQRQAWLLTQLYEEPEVAQWALIAAEAIDIGAGVDHPLIRGMMERSLLNAIGRYI
ncbi:MAG TPA: HEAT repeat domain-containing protein [Chloroflexi bacterium]|nr:HEAT repeat domain-containing protein [Chloroflexota bacterium]